MSSEIHYFSSLPLTTFYGNKKKYRLKFQDNLIIWDNAKPPYENKVIPIENVIGIESNPNENNKQFEIHYAKKKANNKWKHKLLALHHSDAYQVSIWVTSLQICLQQSTKRAANILLFVNPHGGKKTALNVFEKYAKPLFNIAGIDFSVIVSQRRNQIQDLVINNNFDTYDSLVCVGGDGTALELINGLVLRECRLHDIDPHDPNQTLPKPSIPVGIIPGGSTDTTAYCIYGTTDATTAVIHIILGDTLGLDLVSVHDDTNFLKLYAGVLSYGYLGDVAHFSEDLRWMGPARYEYTGFKKIMSNAAYEGEITIMADTSDRNLTKCYENCEECLSRRHEEAEVVKKIVKGKFFMVSGANMSCAGERNPHGLAPYSHLGDGYLYLVIIHHTSVIQSIKTLQKFLSDDYDVQDMPHVEVYRAKEFHFKADSNALPGRWNCDGEVIHNTEVQARVHRQLITVFSRGIGRPTTSNKCCFLS
ncbi:hypothetical protein ILUMI_20757 [Ignelater luminosus]|uniref:DAGKc domain-containing protein n=1 Tax=Ignelater luminosus TaxID=2038154 RepID=A0A8K0CK46_IGNLU|nr:hypothetical protein ILUMI_20757 [Ignelater luminosus]